MACPWDFLPAVTLDFCEKSLCAWVKQPGNTWSNSAYILIGVALWMKARRKKSTHLVWIGFVSVITGLGSAFLHMSGSYLGGCADYFGMFLGTGLLTGYNVRRWLKCSFFWMYVIFVSTTFLFLTLLHLFPDEQRTLYGFGMPCCFVELVLFVRDRKSIQYKHYLLMSLFVSIATLFWWLDVTKQFCDPDNHLISGHAVWHILTAVSFISMYKYYDQFSVLKR